MKSAAAECKIQLAGVKHGRFGGTMRLLAIDMDGTCLDRKSRISEKNLAAMRRAAAAGVEIVPATGRALACLPYQLAGEGYIRYVISSNGAAVTDIREGRELYRAMLPADTAEKLVRECRAAGIGITVHAGHRFYLLGRKLFLLGRAAYGRDANSADCIRDIFGTLRAHAGEIEELQLFYFSERTRRSAREILGEYSGLTAAYDRYYVEVISREAGKGAALAALARHLGADRGETACIGDGSNDLAMFRAAGLSIAVGNAADELKAEADFVVGSNDSGGVAEAIYDHIL